jgi:RND family efflux transporter MFP subunit
MRTPNDFRRRSTRRKIAIAVGALLLGATALTLAARNGRSMPTDGPTAPMSAPIAAPIANASLTVEITTPTTMALARTVAASGSVAPRDELIVGSDANGVRLVDVRVDVGSIVRRGELLARGDDQQLQAQRAQQLAQIRQARAELGQAQANLERAERIEDSGVYSVEALQTRRTNAEAAAAKLELAEATLRELDVRIAHTRVLAPADGVVARRSATVGAVMQPGTELFRLIRDGELEWAAELPAHALGQVAPGAPVRLRLPDGQTMEAAVRLVEPTLDPRSRNGIVRVALPRGAALKSGSHLDGDIAVGRADVMTLPESVVFHRDGQAYVYVVGNGDVATLTRIQTGARSDGRLEVVAGVRPGALVVATGAGFVKDGERVRVVTAPAGQGART